MPISMLISPSDPYKSHAQQPQEIRLARKQPTLTWEDHAQQRDWEQAILSLLKEQEDRLVGLWQAINMISAESIPDTRAEYREATREVLQTVMDLVRRRQVRRYKREWIAILAPQQTARGI